MKTARIIKIKRDLDYSKTIVIKDIGIEHIQQILVLLKNVYGENYPELEFYNPKFLKKFIVQSIDKNNYKIHWKGAFYQDKLIGQMIYVTKHGTTFLISTMVHKDYHNSGVITLIGNEMVKIPDTVDISNMRTTYAIVNKRNLKMIQVLKNFKFTEFGTIPKHDSKESLILFGRIFKDFHWKIIKPHINLSPEIYRKIKKATIKRLISSQPPSIISLKENNNNNNNIEFIKNKDKRFSKNKILVFINGKDKCAEIIEPKDQKSWYDVRFTNNILDFNERKQIIKKIIEGFIKKEMIKSLSFIIEVNDRDSQEILLRYKAKLYAYLPYYYYEYDMLLLGFSKLNNGGMRL